MEYVYFLDVQGVEDERSNAKVFQVIQSLELPDEQIFMDEKPTDRTELNQILDLIGQGDTIIVRSVMDVSNSLSDLINLLSVLESKGVELFSAEEPYLCGTEFKVAFDNFLGLIDHFKEKQKKDRYKVALKQGRVGRPVNMEKVTSAIKLYNSKNFTIQQIEKITGVSKTTLYKYLKEQEVGT